MSIRLFLLASFMSLQSCSNTVIGDKLENSFDVVDSQISTRNSSEEKIKSKEITKLKPSKKIDVNKSIVDSSKITKENRFLSKDETTQKSFKPNKNPVFKPQPYRIILKLSGANPSAPAETVTRALRKAGVQFEVEKIERFDKESLLKNTTFK